MINEPNNTNQDPNELEQFAKKLISNHILPSFIKKNKSSIADFISSFSKGTDKFILQAESDEHINFVAGHAILTYIQGNAMQISFDFYFQNSQGAWIDKKSQSEIFNIDEYLNAQAQSTLLEHKTLKFDIDKPMS